MFEQTVIYWEWCRLQSVVFLDFSEQDLYCYLFMFLFDDQIAGLKIYYKIEENTKISSVEAKITLSRKVYILWFFNIY